jgi:Flp pilus assembly protein TadG
MSNCGWRQTRRRGQSVIELAVAAPLLTLLLFGIVDFGRAFFQYIAVIEAAREGARYSSYGFSNLSNANAPAQDTIQGRIKLADGGLNLPNNTSHIQITYFDTTVTPAVQCAHYDYPTNSIKWDAPYTAPSSGQQKCPKEGDAVVVKVTSDFAPITPLMTGLLGNPFKLVYTSQARIE